MRPALVILMLSSLGGFALMTSQNPPSATGDDDAGRGAELPEVSVTLLGSTRRFQRVDPATGRRSEAIGSVDLIEPLRLTIGLPDGRSVALVARSMSLISSHGIVTDVFVRRPLEPVRFGAAVADLRRTMADLGIEPDELMKEHLSVWPEDAPGFGEGVIPYDFQTGTPAYDKVDLDVKVSPDLEGGWYYLMMFGATVEARKAAYSIARLATLPEDGPSRLATLPEDSPADGEPRPGDRGGLEGRTTEDLPAVSIPLLGSTRQVRGLILHTAVHDAWLPTPEVFEPHRLTVRLPDGKSPTLAAKAMIFLCQDGIIEGVYLRRPMQPVPYAEAVADLRRTMEAIGIAPDERMRQQMGTWPEDAPMAGEGVEPPGFEAETAVSDAVGLRVRVERDPQGGWYSLLLFSATAEAKRAAQAAAGTPDAGPPGHE